MQDPGQSGSAPLEATLCLAPQGKTTAEKFEGIAFTFCKASTIILLTGKFALPIASGAAAIFYIVAYALGKKDTCCWLKWPPLIAGFWGVICLVSTFLMLNNHVHLNFTGH